MENIERIEIDDLSRELINGKGTIIAVNTRNGMGFLREDGYNDIFLQAQGVMGIFDELKEGYRVKFIKIETPKGTKAIGVSVI